MNAEDDSLPIVYMESNEVLETSECPENEEFNFKDVDNPLTTNYNVSNREIIQKSNKDKNFVNEF